MLNELERQNENQEVRVTGAQREKEPKVDSEPIILKEADISDGLLEATQGKRVEDRRDRDL